MKNLITFFVGCSMTVMGFAQLPTTEMYLIKFHQFDDTTLVVSDLELLSDFNRNGYNNQPYFFKNGFLSTISEAGDFQTDLCYFDLKSREYEYLTSTRSASEYSPYTTANDSLLYCVRVDSAGKQNLWGLPSDLSHGGSNLLVGIDNVGYFAQITKDSFVVFLSGEPHQLALVSTKSDKKYVFTSNIGRTFVVKDSFIYYVHKLIPSVWYLKKYDASTRKSVIVSRMPSGVEDFVFRNKKEVWVGSGHQILSLDITSKNDWEVRLDLSEFGLKNLTRLAYKDDSLLVVNKK